jgi:DNA-binding MarR family transcriptional regulator
MGCMNSPAEQTGGNSRHFDSLEQEAFLNLWRTYDRLHIAEVNLFGRFELTPQQYNVLRLLRGEGDHKLATLALAARLVSRAPDITRILDKLEDRGLIERERPSDNRRIVLIGLTDSGRALLADLDILVRECHVRQLGHLSEPQLRDLISLLQAARRPHEDSHSHWLPRV